MHPFLPFWPRVIPVSVPFCIPVPGVLPPVPRYPSHFVPSNIRIFNSTTVISVDQELFVVIVGIVPVPGIYSAPVAGKLSPILWGTI